MDYLPSHDLEVIRYLENKDPKVELEGAIYQFKSERSSRSGIFSDYQSLHKYCKKQKTYLKKRLK